MVELRKLIVERYKGYAQRAELELAPLTILVGSNNSGKTALAQAIQLLAGGMAPPGKDTSEPLPLESGGVRHGDTFADLVSGRAAHGWLYLSATFSDDGSDLTLSVTVRNVMTPSLPSERQVSDWRLSSGADDIALKRQDFARGSDYRASVSGTTEPPRQIAWGGLLPREPVDLAAWSDARVNALRAWGLGVRHLPCPRSLLASPFSIDEHPPTVLGPRGRDTPLALAADDELQDSVRDWYRNAFGVSIDIVAQGSYSELVVRAPGRDANVRLLQSGRGLAQVLPVVVTALTARNAGAGVDVIEHPEAELHPAAHADIAELLLANLPGTVRPMVIETHSEMLLLRARRWVAEARLAADAVLVYWVHAEPGRGSTLRKITINERGALDDWPTGVFIEDYEEVLAIRRAARRRP